jgi:hypothetical protein
MAGGCGEHAAHERRHPAGPARPLASAQAAVRWDEHHDAFAGDLLHLALVPVAGIGEHDAESAKTKCRKLALPAMGGGRRGRSATSRVSDKTTLGRSAHVRLERPKSKVPAIRCFSAMMGWARLVSNQRPLACEAWRSSRRQARKYLQIIANRRG